MDADRGHSGSNSDAVAAATILHGIIGNVAKNQRVVQVGIIDDDFALLIAGWTDKLNQPMRWLPGQYKMARRLKKPPDFMGTTPDGTHGYYLRVARLGEMTAVNVPMEGLIAGEHNHIGTGDHGHMGVHGPTSVNEVPIYAQHQEQHYHRLLTPPSERGIMPGDQVLVIWLTPDVPFVAEIIADSLDVANNTVPGQWDTLG